MKNLGNSVFLSLIVILLGSSQLILTDCSSAETPEGRPVEFSGRHEPSASGLQYSVPEGWIEETPSSSMRTLQFRLPGPDPLKGDAEVAVFTGIGGSVDQNVERWINQFEAVEAPQVDKRIINDLPVTLVDVTGTYSAGMMSPGSVPQPDSRMLAAVIEGEDAPWFVKLVGPRETVAKWENSFTAFVESMR